MKRGTLKDAILFLYRQGKTYREIAAAVERPPTSIGAILAEARRAGELDGPLRTPGPRSAVMRPRVVELAKGGMGPDDIAREIGSTRQSVMNALRIARLKGELPPLAAGAYPDGRERDEDNNVIGKIKLSRESCPVCELRGDHECLPGLNYYIEQRRPVDVL